MIFATKLLDNEQIDFIAGKLEVERGVLMRDIISTSADKPVKIGYGGMQIGLVLAAAEMATGIYVEIDQTEDVELPRGDGTRELAPAGNSNYKDKILRMEFSFWVSEVAWVRERVVGDVNFSRLGRARAAEMLES